jgi:transposase
MRGSDARSGELFSYVDLEKRVPAKHPLRLVRRVVNDVLAALDGDFSKAYADGGRPSIPPERLLRALLLQAFYTVRSERQLIEQLDYNLLYRWFVGLGVDEPVWVPTVFTKNRDRLLEADVARRFLAELMDHKELRGLLSDEHFSVDGTQIAAWASMKSFKAKDGSSDPPGSGRNGERLLGRPQPLPPQGLGPKHAPFRAPPSPFCRPLADHDPASDYRIQRPSFGLGIC